MAILVGVLLWLGMMGGYDRFDQSCANVFCKDLGPFNLGSCQIGWSGYLGKSFESFIFNTTIFVKSGGTIIDFSIFQAFRRGTRAPWTESDDHSLSYCVNVICLLFIIVSVIVAMHTMYAV